MHAIKAHEALEIIYSKLNRDEPDTCNNGSSLSRSTENPVEAVCARRL
jgi:hypothetical protein